jgi:hypothetical protein
MSAHRSRRRRLVLWTAGGLTTVVGAAGAALLATGSGPAETAHRVAYDKAAPRHAAHRARHRPAAAARATAPAAAKTVKPRDAAADGGFAPYVDVGLFPPYDLVDASKRTGVKTFNLAFVVSGGGGCEPRWGGSQALGDNEVAKKINDLRAAGGDVRVSFGGANGTELARACTSAADLAAAYKKVIDTFDLTKVDFDVEGAAIADKAANDRRAEAVATLQKQVSGLDVSFTLPVLPSGLTQDGVNLVSGAKAGGVDISAVNVMAMDYGDGQAPNPDGKMGDYAIQAATSTEKQVAQALGVDDAWNRIAVTPMIGVNDTSTEVFRTADAEKVAAFAKEKHLAWTSMWSATRDKPCPDGPQSWASPTCSSIDQDADAFTKAFTA